MKRTEKDIYDYCCKAICETKERINPHIPYQEMDYYLGKLEAYHDILNYIGTIKVSISTPYGTFKN